VQSGLLCSGRRVTVTVVVAGTRRVRASSGILRSRRFVQARPRAFAQILFERFRSGFRVDVRLRVSLRRFGDGPRGRRRIRFELILAVEFTRIVSQMRSCRDGIGISVFVARVRYRRVRVNVGRRIMFRIDPGVGYSVRGHLGRRRVRFVISERRVLYVVFMRVVVPVDRYALEIVLLVMENAVVIP